MAGRIHSGKAGHRSCSTNHSLHLTTPTRSFIYFFVSDGVGLEGQGLGRGTAWALPCLVDPNGGGQGHHIRISPAPLPGTMDRTQGAATKGERVGGSPICAQITSCSWLWVCQGPHMGHLYPSWRRLRVEAVSQSAFSPPSLPLGLCPSILALPHHRLEAHSSISLRSSWCVIMSCGRGSLLSLSLRLPQKKGPHG